MAKKFIQSAIKHPGAFKAQAQRAGMGTREFALAHQHDSGTTGQRARLALTLMKLGGGKKKKRGR